MLYEYNLRGAGSSGFTHEILNSRIDDWTRCHAKELFSDIGIYCLRVDRTKV